MMNRRQLIKGLGSGLLIPFLPFSLAEAKSNIQSFKIFLIDDGESHWVCSHDERSALNMHFDLHFRYSGNEHLSLEEMLEQEMIELDGVDIQELADNSVLRVNQDDGSFVEKTAKEWAKDGPGFVATTCW